MIILDVGWPQLRRDLFEHCGHDIVAVSVPSDRAATAHPVIAGTVAERMASDLVDFLRADERLAAARLQIDKLVGGFRVTHAARISRQRRSRPRRTWPVVVSRHPAEAPRSLPWTASLRAFA